MGRSLACVVIAVVLAGALDLGCAALHGYRLRSGIAFLLIVETLAIGALSMATAGLLVIIDRLRRRSTGFGLGTALAAGAIPVGLRVAYRMDLAAAALVAGVVGSIGLACLAQRRASGARRQALGVALGVASWVLAALWLIVPQPGQSAIREASGEPPQGSGERPGILVIVLDTARADHLGTYGYARPTSPFLDGFADEAIVFENAYSSSSWTVPAHATLLTGLHVAAHGAETLGSDSGSQGTSPRQLGRGDEAQAVRPLSPHAVTLAELTRDAGYDTGAVCANPYLDPGFGFDQGFATYVAPTPIRRDWVPTGLWIARRIPLGIGRRCERALEGNEKPYLRAAEVNRLALDWLASRKTRPFFLFLNYMDVHEPNRPEGRYRQLFPRAGDPVAHIPEHELQSGKRQLSETELGALIDRYDAEMRYLDDRLAELFGRLDDWGVLDRTLVVVVSDHGESFGEHGAYYHRNSVWEEQVRIPLIIRLPGQTDGRRESGFVHLTDVLPSVLDTVGIGRPRVELEPGLFTRERRTPIVSFIRPGRYYSSFPQYCREQYALYDEPWKLVSRSDGGIAVYDLRSDPNENRDLSALPSSPTPELQATLDRFRQEIVPLFPEGDATDIDPELREQLESLGYVQ